MLALLEIWVSDEELRFEVFVQKVERMAKWSDGNTPYLECSPSKNIFFAINEEPIHHQTSNGDTEHLYIKYDLLYELYVGDSI